MMEEKMNLFEKEVGESFEIELDRYGKFVATLHKIDGDLYIFMFDDCIARHSMNREDNNKGGYENSDMEQWLSTDVFNAFPEEIRKYIHQVSLATAGQIFGHENEFCNKYLVMDKEEQFPLMKKRQNRIACFDDDTCWWWLQNPVKTEHSSAAFAFVASYGNAAYGSASNSGGVRPVFVLVRPTTGGRVPQGEKTSYRNYCGKRQRESTGADLILEILRFGKDVDELHKKALKSEKRKAYDAMAEEMKEMKDSFVRAGFTDEQAYEIVLNLTTSLLGGVR